MALLINLHLKDLVGVLHQQGPELSRVEMLRRQDGHVDVSTLHLDRRVLQQHHLVAFEFVVAVLKKKSIRSPTRSICVLVSQGVS